MAAILLAAYAVWVRDSSADSPIPSDEVRILESTNPGGLELIVWGRVGFNSTTGCIYLLTSDSIPERDMLDVAVEVEWPPGSRAVTLGGTPGVEIGTEFGNSEAAIVLVGDLIIGSGVPGIAGDETPNCENKSGSPVKIHSVRVVDDLDELAN